MTVLQPSPRSPGNGYLVEERRFPFSNSSQLFLASFLSLYFEVFVIRYLTSEVRVFANLKNLLLIASFFGIGLGINAGSVYQVSSARITLHRNTSLFTYPICQSTPPTVGRYLVEF